MGRVKSTGCARSIYKTFSRTIGTRAIQAKRLGTSKTSKCNTFSIRKFRLRIFVYLSKNPVFPRKFPFGKTSLIFHLHSIRNFRIFWVHGKQPYVSVEFKKSGSVGFRPVTHRRHIFQLLALELLVVPNLTVVTDHSNSSIYVLRRDVKVFFIDLFYAENRFRKYSVAFD